MTKNSTAFFGFLLLLLLSLSSNAQQESPPLKAKLKNTYDTTKVFVKEQAPIVKQKLKTFESKLYYGIGGNVAYSTTHGISRIKYSNNGFSGDSFKVMPTIEYAIFGVVQYPISPRLEVEVGLGYAKQEEDIYIYPSTFFRLPITPDQLEKHLVIEAHYLQIPIQFNWSIFQSQTRDITRLNVGMNTKFLKAQENNFNYLIYGRRGMPPHYLTIRVYTAQIGLTQRISLKKSHFDFSIFGAADASKFMLPGFGFLKNVSDSRNVQAGIQLKYFFN